MNVVYTDEALHDLDDILSYIAAHFPTAYQGCELQLENVKRRIGQWPQSARQVAGRPGVRIVPLLRYPYKVFHRVTPDSVEILHVRHSARREP
jgi:toxin ParE1/3/4